MIAFLIEVVKALVTFFAVCVGLGILYTGNIQRVYAHK